MHERENARVEWLGNIIANEEFIVTPLAGDASFRSYFRIKSPNQSRILMDDPPDKESLTQFIHVSQTLTNADVLTPELLAIDKAQGFLLLSDFGDELLLNKLQPHNADDYYIKAINTLLKIQSCCINDPQLPPFDEQFMMQEMELCSEWFFRAYLDLKFTTEERSIIQKTMQLIASEIAHQPIVFIHRDYHSRNLMLVMENEHEELGVIDFQDAMRGPLTYDLVSLLKDCYISWPRDRIIEWVTYFYENCELAHSYSLPEFIKAFDLAGLQRHIKVLGVFCRLNLRDKKLGYMKDLPRTLTYVRECAEMYPELHPFFELLQNRVNLI